MFGLVLSCRNHRPVRIKLFQQIKVDKKAHMVLWKLLHFPGPCQTLQSYVSVQYNRPRKFQIKMLVDTSLYFGIWKIKYENQLDTNS